MPVKDSSRFKGHYVFQDEDKLNKEGEEIMYVTPFRENIVEPEMDDIRVMFEENMRVDLLAYEYYGDVHLDWVIMDANPKYFSPFEIKVGDVIVVPNPERVLYLDED